MTETAPAAPSSEASRGTVVGVVDEQLDAVRFDDRGLVPAVVQDAGDGAVLMLGYMDREALVRTLTTGRSWFWSRSRQEYWCKGETSGDRQLVREVRYDCDGDAVLVRVEQLGRGACHTGNRSCFYRAFGDASGDAASSPG
ncbi:MAG TPA: phosphoribosyl-AMP cyclohydrolase [Acidimicrobiales bacterium]|nr:phosphoribosyl-AMP cyclohydrolase [Acidimicrobiales bacterium]